MIFTVSVLGTGIPEYRIDSLALFRLSDALKCSDLRYGKVEEKSCVRGQIFWTFLILHIYSNNKVDFVVIIDYIKQERRWKVCDCNHGT